MSTTYRDITLNGLWKNNPALVQLLGLCPLLGVSNSAVNALGLGLATMLVLAGSNLAASLARGVIHTAVRLPVFVMIIAALTTCIELLMQAYTYELYQILGIFIPLITTNCVVLGRAEGFAAKHDPLRAAYDGFIMGMGFMLVLVLIGMVRELLGTGAVFANMHLLFGPFAANWQLTLAQDYSGFLLAILPPGAFLVLGFLIAIKNRIDHSLAQRVTHAQEPAKAVDRRVRVTGVIE